VKRLSKYLREHYPNLQKHANPNKNLPINYCEKLPRRGAIYGTNHKPDQGIIWVKNLKSEYAFGLFTLPV